MSDDALFALLGEMRDAPLAAATKKSKGDKSAKSTSGEGGKVARKAWSRKEREGMAAGDEGLWNDKVALPRDMEQEWVRRSEIARMARSAPDEDDSGDAGRDRRPMQRLAVEEACRWRAMNRLALTFKTMAAEKLGVRWTRHFEGWLYARRAVCSCCTAGLFPLGKEAEADVELERKLEAAVQP